MGPIRIVDDPDAPSENPSVSNVDIWQEFLRRRYSVRSQDICSIIRIHDFEGSVSAEWEIWSAEEKSLWQVQLELNLRQQFYFVKGFDMTGNFFLPPGYDFLANNCQALFRDNPDYSRNVFIMTRFVPGDRLLSSLDDELRRVLTDNGMNPMRADDRMYMDDRNLWNNVCVYMICCRSGIAILEDRIQDEFNPNVALEYGFMRALNKPTLLLADRGFRNLRADIIGTLREQFDITDIPGTIRKPVERWLREIRAIG